VEKHAASYLLLCFFFVIASVNYDCGMLMMVNFLIVGKGKANAFREVWQ